MKILILWVGPWLDKGEAAMTISTVKALRKKIPDARITILTAYPPQELDIQKYSKYDLKVLPGILSSSYLILPQLKFLKFKVLKAMIAVPIFLVLLTKNILWLFLHKGLWFDAEFLIRDNRNIVKEYKNADWIIFCGGEYIVEADMGLVIALYEIIFSKLLRKPVMLYAHSFGKFDQKRDKYVRPLIKYVLNKVDLITTREGISKGYLKDIGVTAPVFETADAAFTLPSIPREEALALIEHDAKIPKTELMVGISVIRWKFPGEEDNANKKFENYLDAVAGATDYIIEKLNAHVIFMPQVILPPTKDDRLSSMKVLNKIKNTPMVTILNDDYTPEQLKGMYGCMHLFIGTRFHSCILAQSMHVPTIAIGYRHKALGIMRLLDLEEYVCDINTITTHELISKIDKIWADRGKVNKKLEKNIRVMQAKSKDNVRLAIEYLGLRESP